MLKRTRSFLYLCIATSVYSPSIFANNSLNLHTNPRVDSTNQLPDIGTTAGATLSIDQEIIYGDAYMRMLRGNSPIIQDPVLNTYIDTLGHRLVSHANDVKTPFYFFLLRDRTLNAFAFFGGHVALHSGLFLHAKSEDELAAVMSHEIAHVTQRHLARSMEAQAERSPMTLAALAGSILLAIAAPQAGIAALAATSAGSIQSQINYTRGNEREADRFGLATLARSGFNAQAMPIFFGRLADEYRYASTPPPMLLTHPLPEARLNDTRARAQQYPTHKVIPSLDYHLARARIIVRYAGIDNDAALSWLNYHQKKATTAIQPAFEYGKALVQLDNRQFKLAQKKLLLLLKNDPNNIFYLDALSDAYLGQNQAEKAINMLKQGLKHIPDNRVLSINLANAQIEKQQYSAALQILHRYTLRYSDDLNGWQLTAQANAKLGHRDEELAAQGEMFALSANWPLAIKSYVNASNLAKLGSLQQARYDARIDQLMMKRDQFNSLK